MSIKLIATDIDGTILKYNQKFNQEVIDCIHNLDKKGIKIVLITGRMHQAAKIVGDRLGLKTPIVSYQGALIRDNTLESNILYERYIDNDITKSILNWAKENKIRLNLYLNDKLYVEEDDEVTRKYTGENTLIDYEVQKFDNLNIDKVNKILAIKYGDEETVTQWSRFLQKTYPELYIVKSTPYFCEVCHPEATKGDGIRFLMDYYGIKKEEILAIGDHDNDIELLRAGGVKVAMGNATDTLKSVADYITDTVDNNGFVKAVEKFVKVEINV